MKIPDFELERYFAEHEFSVVREREEPFRDGRKRGYLLCSSDLEPVPMGELLALADPEARQLWEELTLGYCESAGHPLLRREIAGLYPGLAAEDVLTFSGAQEAVFIAMNVLLDPGDHALVTWPGYQSLYEVARSCGAEVELLELREEEGWQLDPDRVRRALRPNTRLIVVNFPHNPTGAALSQSSLEALAGLGPRLLVDEVYQHLGDADPTPACLLHERCLSLNVTSKSFGLAGLRIGWLACRDRHLLGRLAAYKDYTTICNSAPSEILALIGLRSRETLWARSRALLSANLALLDDFFAKHAARVRWVRPVAGSVAFPRLCSPEPVERWCERLRQREGVLLLPGTVYGSSAGGLVPEGGLPPFAAHFRLGFGRADLPQALARLDAFLDAPS